MARIARFMHQRLTPNAQKRRRRGQAKVRRRRSPS
jgi:hypothetical protein